MKNFEQFDNASIALEQLGRAVNTLRTTHEAMYYGPNTKTGYEDCIWFLAEVMGSYVTTVQECFEAIWEERRAAAAKKQA